MSSLVQETNSVTGSVISEITLDTALARPPVRPSVRIPQDRTTGKTITARSTTPITSNSARMLQTITNTQSNIHNFPSTSQDKKQLKLQQRNTWVDRLAYQETVSSRRLKETGSSMDNKPLNKPTQPHSPKYQTSTSSLRQQNTLSDRINTNSTNSNNTGKVLHKTISQSPNTKQLPSKNGTDPKLTSLVKTSPHQKTKGVHVPTNQAPIHSKTGTHSPSLITNTPSIHERLYQASTFSSRKSMGKSSKLHSSSCNHASISVRKNPINENSLPLRESNMSSVHERLYRTTTVSLRGSKIIK